MKNLKKLLLLPLFLLIVSCFEQEDEVKISESGKIEMISTIIIKNDEADLDYVDSEINVRLKSLKKEGWEVSYKWKKKSRPYEIEFVSTNTLNNLYNYQKKTEGENPSGVYVYKKYSDKLFVISFEFMKDTEKRTIILDSKSLPLYLMNEDEKLVAKRIVTSKKFYHVLLIEN